MEPFRAFVRHCGIVLVVQIQRQVLGTGDLDMAMKPQRFAEMTSRRFFRKLGFSYRNIPFCLLGCCTAFSLQAADTNPPVVVTAGCFDGQTIGVCFSEMLDPASATN